MRLKTFLPIITTKSRGDHNIGDTFIGVGMQYLFERVVEDPQWLIVSKFDGRDTFEEYEPYIKEAGCMVFGGMPQYHNFDSWCNFHDDKLWTDVVDPWKLKMFTMNFPKNSGF